MTATIKNPIKNIFDFIVKPIDGWLFFAMLFIYIISMFLLFSADGQDFSLLHKKTIHTCIGLLLLWGLAKINYQIFANFALPFYLGSLILLLFVHFFGVNVNGSTRWLNLFIIRIQPSELMKIALPMMLAWYFQKHELSTKWYHYLNALLIIMIPVGFILKQPDLGTALLIFASGLFIIFFAGISWRTIFLSIFSAILLLPALWFFVMHDYQKSRVMTLLDPTKDPLGAGYHIIQSMIAIGSGGFWGKGWLNGSQTHLDYIPEKTTDFIFAVYGEEFGLFGNSILLIIFTIIIGRGLYIASQSKTVFGRLLAASLSLTLFCYVFVNMGMVSGILPVVGIPLPLMSYGGTSTISILVTLGILMSISKESK